jgi:hypothetical protein
MALNGNKFFLPGRGETFIYTLRRSLAGDRRRMTLSESACYHSPTMKRPLLRLILLLSLLLPAAGGWAQGFWRDLPPDERRQMRQQMREQWQQDGGVRREEGMPRWRDLPPEDRRRLRDEMRERHGWQGPPEGHRDGGPMRGGEGRWR